MFDITTLDQDGAIREAEEAVAGDTRAAFFRKAAIGSGAVLGSGAIMGMLPELAMGKPSKKQDLAILNFALTLEYLEAAFYDEAVAKGALTGDALALAQLLASHENTHVTALKATIKKLGGKAVKSPTFDFKNTTADQATFIDTALTLENTGVHAYLGQAGRLKSKALLVTAATIVTVEARHSGAVAVLKASDAFADKSGASITPDGAFDVPVGKKQILKDVTSTGFIVS